MVEKAVVLWSGGKDSTLALHEILSSGEYEIACLLTTVTEDYDRVSMHGVRRALLELQAASLGTPLEVVLIPKDCSNEEYDLRMAEANARLRDRGVRAAVSGDIFLEDVRAYREERLARAGVRPVFPLWGLDTRDLICEFVRKGYRAVTTCVDSRALDGSWAGRELDAGFLSELPAGVDPCGENGEFHTFVYAGPVFHEPITWTRGEVVLRDGRFYYCDLLPISTPLPGEGIIRQELIEGYH